MTVHPELSRSLIGDADREAAVERLRRASTDGHLTLDEFEDRVGWVYRARSDGELERLVADLPVPPCAPAADVPAPPSVRWTVGVVGRHRRHGPWQPATTTRALAFLGSCRLDVTEAELGPATEIRAVALFGGIEIVVPPGVHVEVSGFSILGTGGDRVRRTSPPPPDAPRVHVRARSVCGGVLVRTPSRPAP